MYRTPTSRFGVRDSTPSPPCSLKYMLTCGTKGHYILPLPDLSKTVIAMTMIHGIVQVLVSLWFYYLTRAMLIYLSFEGRRDCENAFIIIKYM